MKKILVMALALAAGMAMAENGKLAVFVQNRTTVAGMNDEIDGIRDRLSAAIAATEGIQVVDSAQVADTFRRYKVTTDEEKTGLISGIFSGGSVPNVAKMIGCDFIAAASVIGASAMTRNISGKQATVYTLRMTLKIMDSTGASVYGMPPWTRKMPIMETGGDAMEYYNTMIDDWVEAAGAAIANNCQKWRKASAVAPVEFTVTTTIDQVVTALESQTKGVKGEQLQELRKVVGGATIELDGAVIGSAPGTFKTTPGLHQLKIVRDWMKPYQATISVAAGSTFNIALEMSTEGIAKWGSVEALRANVAQRYSEAAATRGIKINVDTQNWRDVTTGSVPTVGNQSTEAPAIATPPVVIKGN